MTKTDLSHFIASKTKLSKANAERAINAFITGVIGALKRSERVTLVGLGTFEVSKRAQRKGRNPRTGKEINIPAKRTPRFRPGREMREAVNRK